jgi:hypothetical protein
MYFLPARLGCDVQSFSGIRQLVAATMMSVIALFRQSTAWAFTKWSMMFAVLFWLLVYKLSQQLVALPEFVYVNF